MIYNLCHFFKPIRHLVNPLPKHVTFFSLWLWVFRNLPITILIGIIGQVLWNLVGYDSNLTAGVLMIVWGIFFDVVCTARYTIISYRIFTKGTKTVTEILIPIELVSLVWLSVSSIVTGLYFVDPTLDKTRYIIHA